jgi:hypothetical protein
MVPSRPTPDHPIPRHLAVPEHRIGRRSVGFVEQDGRRWSCFLVTYPDGDGSWRGHFSFRAADGGNEHDDLRTTDIFLEGSESEVRHKARGLGLPLLRALLASALHVSSRRDGESPFLRRWMRELLAEHSLLLAEPGPIPDRRATFEDDGGPAPDLESLRSLYASYRLDQVAHFVTLVGAEDFERAVEAIIANEGIDFAARDRFQLAMLVVTFIEERLPLPPFEIWVRDFLEHRDRYRAYAHALHREGMLP